MVDDTANKFIVGLSELLEILDVPEEERKEFVLIMLTRIMQEGFIWHAHILTQDGAVIGIAAGDDFCHAAFKENKWPRVT